MKYVVLKDFYDRFDNMKLNQVGDEHNPPNKERANQLIKLGFIKQEEEEKKKPKKKKADTDEQPSK